MRNIITLLLSIFSGVFSAQDVYLHFVDSAIVNDKIVLLEDIARVKGTSNEDVRFNLEKTKIGDAAPAGFSRYINGNDIIHYFLKSQFNNIEIHSSGAKRIKVRTDAVLKSVEDYEKQILEYLNDNISWRKGDYTVSIENGKKQWYCYQGPVTIEVKGLFSPYPKGNIRLKLKVTQGETEFNVPVVCKIRVTTPVVTVSETIYRKQLISAEKLKLCKLDITAYTYTPYTEISSVVGGIATKTLTPGTIIHKRCIKPLPDICKGDRVYIILKKGLVRLSVPARAREEGVKGDRIWVENLNSHKLIRVKIADKGIVYLNEGETI